MDEDISKLFEGFNLEYPIPKAINFLMVNSLVNQITILGLKDFIIDKLSVITNTSEEKLNEEFMDFYSHYQKDVLADFLVRFGDIPNNPEGK